MIFCDKVSVPRFKEDDRESIYNGDIGEGNWSKLILPPEPATGTATQKENDIYEEIDNWLKTLGLLPAIS